MAIKVAWTNDSMEVLLQALNGMDKIQFHDPDKRKMFLSIRDEIEPRINANKRKEVYRPRLRVHQAQIIVYALTHVPLSHPDNPIYPNSLSRQMIQDIQPRL